MMLLATDLDGTFLGGSSFQQRKLYNLLKERSDILLVFVTGRGLESVLSLFNEPEFPYPDYIICDVGGTIVNAHTMEPIAALQAEIDQRWPGHSTVRDSLEGLPGLIYQQVPQHCRCSFFVEDETVLEKLPVLLKVLQCDMIYSANRYLDIMPKGVNKGSSLTRLVELLQVDASEVLVAGDTLNDLAMYQCGFNGVVVGNAEAGLVEATQEIENLYYAKAEGAGGILEALEQFAAFQKVDTAIDVWKF